MTTEYVVERDAVLNNLKIIRAKAGTSLVIGVLKGIRARLNKKDGDLIHVVIEAEEAKHAGA